MSLDALHAMLAKVATDDEIVAGLTLSKSGITKVCKKLGVDRHEAELLIARLRRQLSESRAFDAEGRSHLSEDTERFSYEPDYLNGVMIRDGQTGKRVYIQGTKASDLLTRLAKGEDQQDLLSSFMSVMEGASPYFGKAGAGCIVLAKSTNRILILHRSDLPKPYDVREPSTWGTIGGAIEPGENPESAAIREVGEETGYHGDIVRMVPLYVFKKKDFIYRNFLAIVEHEFRPHLNWESQGYRWCEFGEWPSPLHFGLKALLSDSASVKKIQLVLDENPLNESEKSNDGYDDPNFKAEIENDKGTFNFPWSINGMSGIGTARFEGRGPDMKITVIYAADMHGKKLAIGPIATILNQRALDFIDNV